MANSLFSSGREGFLTGEINVVAAVIKVALVRDYTFSAGHVYVSDVTAAGGTLAATSPALTAVTTTGGVFDADDITYPTVSANAAGHSLLVFQSSAVTGGSDVAQSAQRVIAWIDTGTGLPVVPLGGVINVVFDAGANKIFKL